MIIEITKAGCTNKGAEMMLVTTIQKLKARYPDAKLVVAPNYTLPFEFRSIMGLWHRFDLKFKGISLAWCLNLVPKKLRRRYGFILEKEVDVIVDAAGFAYSEQWGTKPTKDLSQKVERWKSQGKKVILLPQALGPFKNQSIQAAMQNVLANIDLVFPRDQVSLDNIKQIKSKNNVFKCPDFTVDLVASEPNSKPEFALKNLVGLVPNMRIIDKGSESIDDYVNFFIVLIEKFHAAGKKPIFIVHETVDDEKIIARVNKQLSTKLPIVHVASGSEAKWLIGNLDVLVASRYHAIISGLAQGVPTIGTGWAHKYQELYAEYAISDLLVTDITDTVKLEKICVSVLDEQNYQAIQQQLSANKEAVKQQVAKMWDKVFQVIEAK